MNHRFAIATLFVMFGVCGTASAQTLLGAQAPPVQSSPPAAAPGKDPNRLKVTIYPILVWVPWFSASTNVPPFPDVPGGPDLPGAAGKTEASLDGAALAGLSISKGIWRIDADGIWAAMATQRDRPSLNIDLDIVYGHVSSGIKVYKDLYVTGGVRRVALNYDISLEGRAEHFERKPGIWDPLVGLGWHSDLGSRVTLHVLGEGGGFGVGADTDLSGGVRADFNLGAHLGLTLGYSMLYLKLSDTVRDRTFSIKQTMHGPVGGIGIYF